MFHAPAHKSTTAGQVVNPDQRRTPDLPTRMPANRMSKAARAADTQQSDAQYIAQRQARARAAQR